MGVGFKGVLETLRTAFYCACLVCLSVVVVRRDLIPVELRAHLPQALEPYAAASEAVRQGFILALVAVIVAAYQVKGGWMQVK